MIEVSITQVAGQSKFIGTPAAVYMRRAFSSYLEAASAALIRLGEDWQDADDNYFSDYAPDAAWGQVQGVSNALKKRGAYTWFGTEGDTFEIRVVKKGSETESSFHDFQSWFEGHYTEITTYGGGLSYGRDYNPDHQYSLSQ